MQAARQAQAGEGIGTGDRRIPGTEVLHMTYLAGIVIWLSGFGCGIVLAIVVRRRGVDRNAA